MRSGLADLPSRAAWAPRGIGLIELRRVRVPAAELNEKHLAPEFKSTTAISRATMRSWLPSVVLGNAVVSAGAG